MDTRNNLYSNSEDYFHKGGVRRIAFDNKKTFHDQSGRLHTKASPMPIESNPAIFHDNVRVGLEEQENLFFSINALILKDSMADRIDRLFGHVNLMLHLIIRRKERHPTVILNHAHTTPYTINNCTGDPEEIFIESFRTLRMLALDDRERLKQKKACTKQRPA